MPGAIDVSTDLCITIGGAQQLASISVTGGRARINIDVRAINSLLPARRQSDFPTVARVTPPLIVQSPEWSMKTSPGSVIGPPHIICVFQFRAAFK